MTLLNKLITAIRGLFTETVEYAVSNQGTRIVTQKIKDAKANRAKLKEALVNMIAEDKRNQENMGIIQSGIKEHKEHIVTALQKAKSSTDTAEQTKFTDMAKRLDARVTQFERELKSYESVGERYTQSIETMKDQLQTVEELIRSAKRRESLVKATQAMQDTMTAVGTVTDGAVSGENCMEQALKEVEEQQKHVERRMEAASELSGETLDAEIQRELVDGEQRNAETLDDLASKYNV